MDMHLGNKVAVVTGASKGIGLAISQAFAEAGAFVVAGARHNSPELQALETAGSATFVAADLATADGAKALIGAAAERGGIDILVNNTGAVVPHLGGFLTVTDEAWQASIDVNLLSAVRVTREALPHLLKGGGSIVMIGSVNGVLPDSPILDYSATKAAMANLAKGLSGEFGPQGVRVNVISPGPVSTPLWLAEGGVGEQFGGDSGASAQEVLQSVTAGAATGRATTAQEVADLALFLASDRSANITGADVRIDGGYVSTVV
ncbi:MAG: SDR family oxidoreductase [Mycolicibacterium cosmeticum]|nr:SDR family oxidoreductase [Mycolicibacterium cosmeticum]